ncbi:hypothetical protein SHIRM173S_02852 [Streptomyces hirsutus]
MCEWSGGGCADLVAGRAGGCAVAGGVRADGGPGPGRGRGPVQGVGQGCGQLMDEVADRWPGRTAVPHAGPPGGRASGPVRGRAGAAGSAPDRVRGEVGPRGGCEAQAGRARSFESRTWTVSGAGRAERGKARAQAAPRRTEPRVPRFRAWVPVAYAGGCRRRTRASQSVRVRRAVAEMCACGYRASKPWKPPAQRGVRPGHPPSRCCRRRRCPRHGRPRRSRCRCRWSAGLKVARQCG